MVTSNLQTEGTPFTTTHRGFVPEETLVLTGVNGTGTIQYRPFWRPVLAGTVFATSIFALSWYLMLGVHVGVTHAGVLAPGIGSAVWMWVTACAAFYFGSLIASAISPAPTETAWLKGAVIWGLSIPLTLVVYSFALHSAGLLRVLELPDASILAATPQAAGTIGFAWCAFILLGCALIASLVGSATGSAFRRSTTRGLALQ